MCARRIFFERSRQSAISLDRNMHRYSESCIADLGEAQGKTLWTELVAAPEFDRDEEYWFPLTDSSRKDVVAFQAPHFSSNGERQRSDCCTEGEKH